MKDILRSLSITIALAVSSSCAPVYDSIPNPSSPNTVTPYNEFTPLPTPSSLEIDLFKDEARKYYPQLIEQYLPLAETTTIYSGNNDQEIRFFNLNEDFSLDVEAIKNLISTYKLYPNNQPETIYQYNLTTYKADNQLRFPLDIVFFVLPENAPRTDWNEEKVTFASSSGLLGQGEVYLSFAEQKPQKIVEQNILINTVQDELSKGMAVELCQVLIEVKSDSIDNTQLLQEITCNSLGIAHWFKIKGYNHNEYQSIASQIIIGFSGQQARIPIINFNEEVYNSLPAMQLLR